MTSPFTVPKGVQKHGDMEFEWLPMLRTPCNGFSGPSACYSSTCKHSSLSHKPTIQFLTQNRRKYPILNKPPFFKLFQMKNALHTFAPKPMKEGYEPEITSTASEWSATETYSSDTNDLQHVPYNTYDLDPVHNSDVYEGQCDVPVESSFEQLFDTKGDSSPYAASSFQMLETCAEIAINAYDDQPEEQTLLADDNDADCMSLESPNENVSAKKYTFNPLSKPFEPARTSCSTSDYCSQSDSTSSKSQSPLPVQSESDASDCPSSSSSSSSQSLSTSSPSPKKTPLATTTHLSATGNLKQVFQSFFDAHSMQSTVTKDTTTTATTQSKLRKPTKTKFVCVLCSEQFRTVDELRKHILDKILKSYECIICGETYTHKYLMQRHRASHRSMPQFPCRGCSKKFRSFVQLDKHFDTCRFKLYIYA